MSLLKTRAAGLRHAQIGHLTAILRFFRDPNASLAGKISLLMAVVYVVMPIDAIPDVVPVIGWLDDLGVVTLAMAYLARVVARYREADLMPAYVPLRVQR